MPVGLSFPLHYKEELDINLPGDEWNLREANANVQCATFVFNKASKVYNNRIIINYDYERMKDNVMPDEASSYFTSLQTITDKQDYKLTWDEASENISTPSTGTLVNVAGIIFIVGGLIVKWRRKR
jgi:hypothetical protein